MTGTTDQIKLVIADDHLVLRQALGEILTSRGNYTVVGEAADGPELISMVQQKLPDVIIVDIAMPKMNGIDAITELGRVGSKCPVLVLSADESVKNVRAALKAGAKGFLPKQVALSELQFAIEAILAGKTYLSPSVTESLMKDGSIDGQGESPFSTLTEREKEIVVLLANGTPNREIGKMLHISTRTVDTHRSNILKKLKVKTNAELVKLSIAHGVVSV